MTSRDAEFINLTDTPAHPSQEEMDAAMEKVSVMLETEWSVRRLGAQYTFRSEAGGYHKSRRRDFRVAVADATGLTVVK
jgi:hypothetical protein